MRGSVSVRSVGAGTLRSRTRLLVVAVTALTLAACGESTSKSSATGSSATTSASTPSATTAPSPPEQFRQVLVSHSGFTTKQADCIVKKVLAKIGRPEFNRLYGKGNTPQRVRAAILQANLACAPRGAGQ
jgi:hypothetical protein